MVVQRVVQSTAPACLVNVTAMRGGGELAVILEPANVLMGAPVPGQACI